MHQISDGERRRVQLCMGLMGEWDVLLLDEVTVDLDVLVRSELIDYLVQESETRGATIVCTLHSPPQPILASITLTLCHITSRILFIAPTTANVQTPHTYSTGYTSSPRT